MSLAVTGGARTFQLSTLSERGEVIGSSVVIPLTAVTAVMLPSSVISLVLYAGTPGALIDVAADLAWITGRDMSEFGLNQHLTPPLPVLDACSVRAQSTVDQAVGVLIGRGRTPEQATHDLALLAVRDDTDLPAAAAAILDGLP